MSGVVGRMDEEWPTSPDTELLGNGVVLPPKPPDGQHAQVYIVVSRFRHIVPPPSHHTQGAKTIPGPSLTEPER